MNVRPPSFDSAKPLPVLSAGLVHLRQFAQLLQRGPIKLANRKKSVRLYRLSKSGLDNRRFICIFELTHGIALHAIVNLCAELDSVMPFNRLQKIDSMSSRNAPVG